ncbi:MAG: GNAT family N-acetyltransferase [Bacteroidota bacterium]
MEDIGNAYRTEIDKWHSEILTAHYIYDPDVAIRLVKDFDSAPELNELWNDIVLRSSQSTIYQTYEWIYSWWNSFAADNHNTLHILLISHCGKLIGIAPLFIKCYSLFGFNIYRQLKLIGCGLNSAVSHSLTIEVEGLSNHLDIIVADGCERKTAEAVAAYLDEFKYFFDEIDFQNVPEESFIFTRLIPLLQTKNFNAGYVKTKRCRKLNLPDSIKPYLEFTWSKNSKHSLMKDEAEREYCFEIENVGNKDFANAFQTLKHLHQKGWDDPALTADKRFEKFILKISEEFPDKDRLRFKVVKHHNKIIAARLAFEFNNYIYEYMSGFDERESTLLLKYGVNRIFAMDESGDANNPDTVGLFRDRRKFKQSRVGNNYRVIVKHYDWHNGLKMKCYYMIKVYTHLMFHFNKEKAMIKLHMQKHGKITFLNSYVGFCLHRLRSYTQKQKASNYILRKTPGFKSKNNFVLHAGRKNRNRYSPSVERS